MSGGIGLAGGFGYANEEPVVAFIGDGTFLHSGIPALINAVHNLHNFVLVILDNSITAMTGHQPNPSSAAGENSEGRPQVSIEHIVKASGVEQVQVVNSQNIKESMRILKKLKKGQGVRVLISRQPCIVHVLREAGEIPVTKFVIYQENCTYCGICINDYSCPAFELDENRDVRINEALCIGCGDCVEICPYNAIVKK
jgi:indolepyruvate ferredoxin oxidoreductase alpha subunit